MSITLNGSSYLELTGDYVGSTIAEAMFIWIRPRGASLTGNTAPFSIGVDGAGGELSIITIGGASVRAQSRNGGTSAFAEQSQTLSDTWIPILVRFNSQTSRDVRVASVGPASDTTDNRMLDAGTPNRMRIGVRGYELNLYFEGDVAEPALWAGTLPDATDWTALQGGAAPETIKSGSLVWHRQLLSHTNLAAGAAGSTPTAVGTISTGATHPITRGDTTPPTLSSPTGTGGLGVCSGTVSTNEAAGDLYAVATASATQPSQLQVRNGQDHTGATALRAVSQAVSSTGTQTVASGAITGGAGTRFLHYMHEDAAGNRSAVVSSAGFSVTASATSMTIPLKLSDGTSPAASITAIHWKVLNAATLGAATSILGGGTAESTDASGNLVLDITGFGLAPGDVRYVVTGKSNGTVGANFDGWHGPAAAG